MFVSRITSCLITSYTLHTWAHILLALLQANVQYNTVRGEQEDEEKTAASGEK